MVRLERLGERREEIDARMRELEMRERLLDGVLILSVPTRVGSSQLTQISDQVRQHAAKLGLSDQI